jgi:Protein of unknown function (DUF1638)
VETEPLEPLLIIACGAIAREIVALRKLNDWSAMDVQCLPPELHNRPERIPDAVRAAIASGRERYSRIFVAYADCGTGGRLDAVLEQEGVDRLPGAHCYEFFATAAVFAELSEAEPGTFYLTDFLVRYFDRLVVDGLGIGRNPELATEYFRHYRRVVYLAQRHDDELARAARAIAERLQLEYSERFTGYGELATSLAAVVRMPRAARAMRVVSPSWPR